MKEHDSKRAEEPVEGNCAEPSPGAPASPPSSSERDQDTGEDVGVPSENAGGDAGAPGEEGVPSAQSVAAPKPVERLFPFVLRSRILIVGRDALVRSKSRLHFVLVTTDLSEASRSEVLLDFKHYPVLQHYTTADLERFFRVKGAKMVGFQKSGLAQSLYAELREYRLNPPLRQAEARKPEK